MRSLLLVALALVLSACASTTARKYDPVEYERAVMISVNATHAVHRCDRPTGTEYLHYLQALNSDSFILEEYVANKGDTAGTLDAAKQIRLLVQEFLSKDGTTKYSTGYCKHKLSNIQASARIYARATALSDRFDLCEGDVKARYDLFEKSYKAQAISKAEFTELVDDLIQLTNIDSSGCSLAHRKQLEDAIALIKIAFSLF